MALPKSLTIGLLVLSGIVACQQDPTQLVVVVGSDFQPEEELERVRVFVTDPGTGEPMEWQHELTVRPAGRAERLGEVEVPFSFGVVPRGGDVLGEARVQLHAMSGGSKLVSVSARAGFVENRALRLPMFLWRDCVPLEGACEPSETCQIIDREPLCVEDYREDLDPLDPEGELDVPTTPRGSGSIHWSQVLGGAGDITIHALAVDSAEGGGDAILVGEFTGELDVVPGPSVVSDGKDAFVARIDGEGAVLWVKAYQGPGDDVAHDVAVDESNGEIVVVGEYTVALDIGDAAELPVGAVSDGFVLRFGSDGEAVSAFGVGTTGAGHFRHVAIHQASGAVVVAGPFNGTMLEPCPITQRGGLDIGVFLFDREGGYVDCFSAGGDQDDEPLGLDVHQATGDILLSGRFQGTGSFGGEVLDAVDDTPAGFVLRLAPDLSVVQAEAFAGTGTASCRDVAAEPVSGDAIVACSYAGRAALLSWRPRSTDDASDFMVARLRPNGTVAWRQRFFGAGENLPVGLVAREQDSQISVVGQFSQALYYARRGIDGTGEPEAFLLNLTTHDGVMGYVQRYRPGTEACCVATSNMTDDHYFAGTFSAATRLRDGILREPLGRDGFLVRIE